MFSPLRLFLHFALAVLCLGGASCPAECALDIAPLGIALEGYPYPAPVQFLPLELESQSLRMAYMDVRPSGRANGQTIVLLHGKNFGGYYWAGTIRALTAQGYRVIVPDQIGWGKSSKPDIRYSFDLLAANTAHLLDTLGVGSVILIGHSTGGMLAVRFARTYPQRVTRLVLEDPVGLEDYRRSIPPQTFETLFHDELTDTDPAKIRAFYAHYFARPHPEISDPLAEVQIRVTQSGEWPRWAKASALTYQMIYQQPVRAEFNLLVPPTLLIIGREDRTVVGRSYAPPALLPTLGQYPALGRAAARDIPHCRFIEIPNVGHIPHLEAPERFYQALLSFLQSKP